MKFFIDTANVNEIREAIALGMVDGVTTNPSLAAKEGRNFLELVKEICSMVDGPVSVEAVSLNAAEIVKEGREFAKISDNIVVKIPLMEEGLKAVRVLSDDNIPTNVTLCFSPAQALLAAKAGASYISPFVGRLDDISISGMELIGQILTIYNNYGYETEVIVASVRHPLHVVEAAILGADIATIPFKVMKQLIKHPLTDSGIETFLSDWKKLNSSLEKK